MVACTTSSSEWFPRCPGIASRSPPGVERVLASSHLNQLWCPVPTREYWLKPLQVSHLMQQAVHRCVVSRCGTWRQHQTTSRWMLQDQRSHMTNTPTWTAVLDLC